MMIVVVVRVVVIDPATGKHPHATEGDGGVPAHHQHLEAIVAVPQQQNRRCRDEFGVIVHRLNLVTDGNRYQAAPTPRTDPL